jgi:hypothetical protein
MGRRVHQEPTAALANMRYMTIDLVRVKSGRVAEFGDAWRMMVAAQWSEADPYWAAPAASVVAARKKK